MRNATTLLFSIISLFLFTATSIFANTDKYRVIWVNDPATTATIGWNQISGNNAAVHYDVVDHGTGTTSGTYAFSKTPDVSYTHFTMENTFARLSGLTPNTVYYFIIEDSEGSSQQFSFKTAPNDPSVRLSFIAGGDSRNNTNVRINANKMVAKLRPHAVLFGGDMTNLDVFYAWTAWFDHWQYTTGSDGRMTPIVPARGNHEKNNESIYKLFDTNTNVYYATTFGGNLVRMYTLNTHISITGAQTTWLEDDLSDPNNCDVLWKMAQYHKPMRPHVAGKAEGNTHYTAWAPLFYEHNVNLVVDCDSHTSKSTWPITPSNAAGSDEGFVRDDNDGTVYIGEGCWGAPLRNNDDNKTWTRDSGMFNQFKWIFIDENGIEARTIRYDNVDLVGVLDDNTRFNMPANIDIWNPSNGAVIAINSPALAIETTFPSDQQTIEMAMTTLTATAAANGTISAVEFYIDGALVGSDATAPFTYDWTPPAVGVYGLSTKVINTSGLEKTTCEITVSVIVSLPIELKTFNAKAINDDYVRLDWESLTEIDFDRYEIERAGSNGEFKKLFSLSGKGSATSGAEYKYIDEEPISGSGYYRLKLVDLDGEIGYSEIKEVRIDKTISNIKVYPNPTLNQGQIQIEFFSIANKQIEISILDIDGKEVYAKTITSAEGQNQLDLQSSLFSSGIYLLQLKDNLRAYTRKLVIR